MRTTVQADDLPSIEWADAEVIARWECPKCGSVNEYEWNGRYDKPAYRHCESCTFPSRVAASRPNQ